MSIACRCCSCPATSSPTACRIRCCSRSRISATARRASMTASGRCRAISTASRGPSRLIPALNRAMAVLTDPAECGPVTLALCQDVQAEAYDYPESFFDERLVDAAPRAPRRARTGSRRSRLCARRRSRRSSPAAACCSRKPRRHLSGFAERARHSGFRNAGRQVVAAVPRSAQYGRDRRHRHECGQRRLRRTPMSFWRSARGCRISPPAPGRCSRIPTRRSSVSTRRSSMPPSIARCRWSPMRGSGLKSSPPISATGRRRRPGPRRRRTASRPG